MTRTDTNSYSTSTNGSCRCTCTLVPAAQTGSLGQSRTSATPRCSVPTHSPSAVSCSYVMLSGSVSSCSAVAHPHAASRVGTRHPAPNFVPKQAHSRGGACVAIVAPSLVPLAESLGHNAPEHAPRLCCADVTSITTLHTSRSSASGSDANIRGERFAKNNSGRASGRAGVNGAGSHLVGRARRVSVLIVLVPCTAHPQDDNKHAVRKVSLPHLEDDVLMESDEHAQQWLGQRRTTTQYQLDPRNALQNLSFYGGAVSQQSNTAVYIPSPSPPLPLGPMYKPSQLAIVTICFTIQS